MQSPEQFSEEIVRRANQFIAPYSASKFWAEGFVNAPAAHSLVAAICEQLLLTNETLTKKIDLLEEQVKGLQDETPGCEVVRMSNLHRVEKIVCYYPRSILYLRDDLTLPWWFPIVKAWWAVQRAFRRRR